MIFKIIILFALINVFCLAEDIEFGVNNNIGVSKYLSIEKKITSQARDGFILPSYEVKLLKNSENIIKEVKVRLAYYYGENMILQDSFLWTLDSYELIQLNNTGSVIKENVLKNIKRDNIFLDADPKVTEEEYLSHTFFKLICSK
jgi:hypothetical protein